MLSGALCWTTAWLDVHLPTCLLLYEQGLNDVMPLPPSAPASPPPRPPALLIIAGYVPGSDVTQHNRIDLDQKEIEAELKARNFTGARFWYTTGSGTFQDIHPGGVPQ